MGEREEVPRQYVVYVACVHECSPWGERRAGRGEVTFGGADMFLAFSGQLSFRSITFPIVPPPSDFSGRDALAPDTCALPTHRANLAIDRGPRLRERTTARLPARA